MVLIYMFFVLLYLAPIVIFVYLKLSRKKLAFPSKISLYIFAISYGLIIYSVFGYEVYLEFQLNKFDLNNDGMFNGLEITASQELAMSKVISDTGRTFAPLTGFICSSLISLLSLLILKSLGLGKST
ncbi:MULTISPECIES: hypothetical protein [unclassified Colwellia]|jgi:hypothetical protein|uniref:hypothetical protein n=1 Tax=unclassified Colwellia TaxID=196834 RepID=UPI0015F36489|nr:MULTISPECIES: hypothetical protein [unclassified Colwellia]MBA6354169.1 hypothetical protein [Colwellia sp. BRX9-1]MBA6355671.1 hypothetical protein [Colwellia sp. BRX8-3]MBA6361460.1 hypothetical protein [Colwellia sp. BRX8-6]MBA6367178.1 hypothetical protein [Colwellia sp. BRX8-5]MBA6376958.1 hypothetical protein [Colwellia sp. BRX8-2]